MSDNRLRLDRGSGEIMLDGQVVAVLCVGEKKASASVLDDFIELIEYTHVGGEAPDEEEDAKPLPCNCPRCGAKYEVIP